MDCPCTRVAWQPHELLPGIGEGWQHHVPSMSVCSVADAPADYVYDCKGAHCLSVMRYASAIVMSTRASARPWVHPCEHQHGTLGLVAMTSAQHTEGRQLDPGRVYCPGIGASSSTDLLRCLDDAATMCECVRVVSGRHVCR